LEVIFHPLPVFTYICIFIVTHFFCSVNKKPPEHFYCGGLNSCLEMSPTRYPLLLIGVHTIKCFVYLYYTFPFPY